jgi:hypothetical protein
MLPAFANFIPELGDILRNLTVVVITFLMYVSKFGDFEEGSEKCKCSRSLETAGLLSSRPS